MVREKISYAIVVVLLLSIAGCTKISKQDTTIEFVIRNPANGQPFVGVPVQILEVKDTEFHGMVSEPIFEGVTDVNGRVKHTFKAKLTSKYWYIPVIEESYFSGTYGVDWTYISRPNPFNRPIKVNQYNEALYEVVYYAYLKEIYKNVNCEGIYDTLFVNYKSALENSGEYVRDIVWTGCNTLTTSDNTGNPYAPQGYYAVPMGKKIYNYEIHRPSGITYGKDSIYLDAGELKTFELNY
jgi:hypothetical protein